MRGSGNTHLTFSNRVATERESHKERGLLVGRQFVPQVDSLAHSSVSAEFKSLFNLGSCNQGNVKNKKARTVQERWEITEKEEEENRSLSCDPRRITMRNHIFITKKLCIRFVWESVPTFYASLQQPRG